MSDSTENSAPTIPSQCATKKAMWERKLLDLGLRNQLINMRRSRTLIPLISSTINELEDVLADGKEFTITPKPDKLVIPEDYTYESLITGLVSDEEVKKAFTKQNIYSPFTDGELKKTIKEVYRAAKTSIEENGANTLYLALGLLRWFEEKGTNPVSRYAPILLVPIEIIRKSASIGYAICLRDDEPQLNITLLEKLKQDFRIEIDGLDPLPQDEHGIDTRKIFDTIREKVKDQPNNWDVVEVAAIGVFSFTQFVMWNDLNHRSDDLMKNKIVKSLLEGKLSWAAEGMASEGHVSEDGVFEAMPTDASQLFAIKAACENKSFVLHGPPGTGKSQTITSLIANALGQGKRVLFVAEKMAALEVVQKRLASIGLAPFCLELHSNKAKKKAVLEKLGQMTEFRRPKASDEYNKKAAEIANLRTELDAYSEDLHKKQSCGYSIYDLISNYENNSHYPDLPAFNSEFLGNLSADSVKKQNDSVANLVSAGRAVGHPATNALARVGVSEYKQSLKEELVNKANDYLNSLNDLLRRIDSFATTAGLTDVEDDEEYNKLLTTAEQVQKWDTLPKSWLETPSMNITMTQVAEMGQRFAKAKALHTELEKNWKPEFFKQDGHLLSSTYTEKSNSWFIPRIFGLWNLKRKLAAYSNNGINPETLGADLANLKEYQAEKTQGDELFKKHSAVIDSLYDGDNTDWNKVSDYATAAKESFSKISEIYADNMFLMKLCSNKDVIKSAKELYDSCLTRNTAHEAFASVAKPRVSGNFAKPVKSDVEMCIGIKEHADDIKEWTLWNHNVEEVKAEGLENVVDAYRNGMGHDDVMGAYKKSLAKGLVAYSIDQSKSLNNFSGQVFNDKIQQYITLDKQISTLGNRETLYRLASKLPDFTKEAAQSSELGILQRAIKSGGRGTSLRKLFSQIPNLLPKLCPCMLMSPISAAQYIDPKGVPFDLVIFDEASQLTTSKAVGALARGKDAIIVGDPKQMPPTAFFSSASVDEENLELEDMESILDDCLALNMPQTHLLWHYRSRHESLIAFSNHKFYESKLFTFPSVDDRKSKVTFVEVKGTFDHGSNKRYNRAEAEAIVEEIKRRFKDPVLSKQSIGVVTFNISQQNLIDDLFTEACKADTDLEAWAYKGEDPLFIKNLENVQGDERDVILFSIGYGPDNEGKVSMNFGPLNREGGWRRLNVAVSRSKREMMVFSSLLPEQINPAKVKSEGPLALRAFLDYARNPKGLKGKESALEESKNGIIISLAKALEEKGYTTDTNIGNSEFKVDLGVVDPKDSNRYLLGILMDGSVYADCRTTRDRELSQTTVLKSLGWNIMRMWSMDWWESRETQLEKLFALLEQLKNNQPVEEIKNEPEEDLAPVEYEEPGAASSDSEESSAEPYMLAKLPSSSLNSEDFMARKNLSELKKRITAVIKAEAPITENLLTKRVLSSYGINRAGSKVQGYLSDIFAGIGLKASKQSDGQRILWASDQEPANYSAYRVSNSDADKRDPKDIPIIEAANAAYQVVCDNIALSSEDLVKLTSKRLGFARLGSNLTTLIESAVAYSKAQGLIEVSANGNITKKA